MPEVYLLRKLLILCISGGTFRELYKKFYDGAWHENIPNMTILNMLQDEEWDIISIQRSAAEDRYCGSGDGSDPSRN